MKYVFYITNHGFGHASRNVPIIRKLLESDPNTRVFIKSDYMRCVFLRRNLFDLLDKLEFYEDCQENGLILKSEEMVPDIEKMKEVIKDDFMKWDAYVSREIQFLLTKKPSLVISDVVCWALKAAKVCGIKSVLIGNFTWAQMYKSFYEEDIWGPYLSYYKLADKAIWYDIHSPELDEYCRNYECVSLVSRKVNEKEVQAIRARYRNPLIFVSLGASAQIPYSVDVSTLPYDFAVTMGVHLTGKNVHVLPDNMINTPDYVAASTYVIAKGGWSTVSEILLQHKRCALLMRGNNSEDNLTREILEKRNHCVIISDKDMFDIKNIIEKIKLLNPDSYDIYTDDTDKIVNRIISML